ncbi:MAG: LLM class flavin-dependent oxidoreductase, partial [Halioglobus sp.]|nr:LLM class flavin-dependent oxidoreductase [Halioglobus sp.]
MHIATTPWDWQGIAHADSLCAQAEAAEAMGLHSFWLPENHFGGSRAIPSPLTQLAAVAARTTSIRLGCTSYLLPIRHPLQAAEEVAVLDQLSGGRLILGLGRGLGKGMFDAFGVQRGDKRALFSEKLDIMRRAWAGEAVHESADDKPVVLSPLPVQRPEPPL